MTALASALVTWVFPGLMVVAALTDLTSRRIPNWIPGAMLVGFALLAIATGMDLATLAGSLAAGLIAFAIGFALFAIGQMGGGDVKLIAASLPWYGWGMAALGYVVTFSIFGALLTIVFLVRRLPVVQLALASNAYSARLIGSPEGGREVPYGIAIAAGAIMTHASLVAAHLAG